MSWYFYKPYVSVAKRRANAISAAAKIAKKEKRTLAPIKLEGTKIASSFWGKAWCRHLEGYSDYENRLPRGRSYVRNGSVIDLQIARGKVTALVSGSEIYKITIDIKTLPASEWTSIKSDCSRSIDSLIDLLRGKLDDAIMKRLTQPDDGLFPKPKQIQTHCNCPDSARMCKHIAAVLYGVGARLDAQPELLFTLRAVDHLELINQAVETETFQGDSDASIAGGDLGEIFGIDLDVAQNSPASGKAPPKARAAKKSVQPKAKAKPPRTAKGELAASKNIGSKIKVSVGRRRTA